MPYALTIFIGALLLFAIQPLAARRLLPWFGGGPGVWTTCMMFFQVALLAGYAYAHALSRRPRRTQVITHTLLIVASLALLPLALGDGELAMAEGPVTMQLLTTLVVSIGLPFVVLASTSPLMQAWFSRSMPKGGRAYRLYALSNAGSLLALVSYPFILEPWLSLNTQGWLWGGCFVAFAVLTMSCAWRFGRQRGGTGMRGGTGVSPVTIEDGTLGTRVASPADGAADSCSHEQPGRTGAGGRATSGTRDFEGASHAAPPSTQRRFDALLWLLLAACGSVLLLATTNQICQDVAPVPFLWILPLSIYLITFILTFDRPAWYRREVFVPLMVVAVGLMAWLLGRGTIAPLWLEVSAAVAALFAGCMVCHGELVRLRPPTDRLTAFYLTVAAGGGLGGVLVAIVAPSVLNSFAEYPLSLLACFALLALCLWRDAALSSKPRRRFATVGATAAVTVTLAIALLLPMRTHRANEIDAKRNFFGLVRIEKVEFAGQPALVMRHGRTIHALQLQDPALRRRPTMYYGRGSGVYHAIRFHPRRDRPQGHSRLNIGVVGLGAGVIGRLTEPGDRLHYYEINPAVVELAREHFTFLESTPADVEITLGDARVNMAAALRDGRPEQYDVLIVDAFNGDAVPTHLLTREAFDIYRRHLKPDGVLAVHASNRYFELGEVARTLARDADLHALRIVSPDDALLRATVAADWVLITASDAFAAHPIVAAANDGWPNDATTTATAQPWTDDHASLWAALKQPKPRDPWADAPRRGRFVIDDAELLTHDDEQRLQKLCRQTFLDTGGALPIMIVTVDSVAACAGQGAAFDAFAARVFHETGLRQRGLDTGVLILIAQADRRATIRLGAGWPRQPQVINAVLDRTILAGLRSDRAPQGIEAGVHAMLTLARESTTVATRTSGK